MEIPVLDRGFVKLVGILGDDTTPLFAARLSFGGDIYDDFSRNIRLLKFLMLNGHWSPFEHVVVSLLIKAPIFVARQLMRYRTFSYNEVSQRFTPLKNTDFYIPETFRAQSKENKQASSGEFKNDALAEKIYQFFMQSQILYDALLEAGVAREQARIVMPVAVYTKFIMTGNLRNWFHVLEERLSENAQYETRQYALAIREILSEKLPIVYSLWELYKQNKLT